MSGPVITTRCHYNPDCNKQFISSEYLKRYTDPTNDPMKVHSKFLEHWHDFYNTHKDEFDPSRATLLELGGGPTIHSLISACQHVSKITFSDYADTNRREIQLWKDNDAKCHNWTPYIHHVVSNFEGNSKPGAVDQRTRELRNKIDQIIPCDVKSEDMLGPYQKLFDVVHTNLCLEIVCETPADFINALSNLRKLVKPGGYLLCLTAKEGSWYTCAGYGTKLHQLFLNESEILKAFGNSGFKVRESHSIDPLQNPLSATRAFQFTVAQNPFQEQ